MLFYGTVRGIVVAIDDLWVNPAVHASVVAPRNVTKRSAIVIDISKIEKHLDELPVLRVAMPPLATDRGPEDWHVVPQVNGIQLGNMPK